MLSRRHLRIKVLQALYAYFQDAPSSLEAKHNEMLAGTEKSYDLFLLLLQLFIEFDFLEQRSINEESLRVTKGRVVERKRSFSDILFLKKQKESKEFSAQIKKRKLSWQADHDVLANLFLYLKKTETYKEFISGKEDNAEDKAFLLWMFKDFIMKSEALQHLIEDKSIYYADSLDFMNSMVIKLLKSFEGELLIPDLYKEKKEDEGFMKDLFMKTINNSALLEELVSAKTKKWDVERIALMDILLIKLALCEILFFPNIPVKVSINEYIDISKEFSTPKSKEFINGIVDAAVIELRSTGKIVKTGRGLIED